MPRYSTAWGRAMGVVCGMHWGVACSQSPAYITSSVGSTWHLNTSSPTPSPPLMRPSAIGITLSQMQNGFEKPVAFRGLNPTVMGEQEEQVCVWGPVKSGPCTCMAASSTWQQTTRPWQPCCPRREPAVETTAKATPLVGPPPSIQLQLEVHRRQRVRAELLSPSVPAPAPQAG